MKKVALIIAQKGYQPVEYGVPKEILTNAGIEVVTVANEIGTAIAKDGSETEVEMTIDQVKASDFDGVFIIGGGGAMEYLNNEVVHELVRSFTESEKAYGAICISPRILAEAGVLKGKKATGWNKDDALAGILEKSGATLVVAPCVVDGNLVTADGPDSAEEFGRTILELV
jgi:protease I